jgi:hypothetical protein
MFLYKKTEANFVYFILLFLMFKAVRFCFFLVTFRAIFFRVRYLDKCVCPVLPIKLGKWATLSLHPRDRVRGGA